MVTSEATKTDYSDNFLYTSGEISKQIHMNFFINFRHKPNFMERFKILYSTSISKNYSACATSPWNIGELRK